MLVSLLEMCFVSDGIGLDIDLSSIDEDYSDSPLTVFKGSNDRGFWLYNLWENVENLYQINNVGETKNALQECFVRNLNCQI